MSASFSQRYSLLIARFGYSPLPTVLLDNMGRLGLTPQMFAYLVVVLNAYRGTRWPRVSLEDVARVTGAGERSVKDWRGALVNRGLVKIGRPGRAGGGPPHDLSPLFAQLELLARSAAFGEVDLPEPTYLALGAEPHIGGPRRLDSRRASPERHPRNKDGKTSLFEADDTTNKYRKASLFRKEYGPEPAPIPGTIGAGTGPYSEATPINPDRVSTTDESTYRCFPGGAASATPALNRLDDGTRELLETIAEALDDDDPERTRVAVEHYWFNTHGLSLGELDGAMKAARRDVEGLMRRRHVVRPMAVWLRRLVDELDERCKRRGLVMAHAELANAEPV